VQVRFLVLVFSPCVFIFFQYAQVNKEIITALIRIRMYEGAYVRDTVCAFDDSHFLKTDYLTLFSTEDERHVKKDIPKKTTHPSRIEAPCVTLAWLMFLFDVVAERISTLPIPFITTHYIYSTYYILHTVLHNHENLQNRTNLQKVSLRS